MLLYITSPSLTAFGLTVTLPAALWEEDQEEEDEDEDRPRRIVNTAALRSWCLGAAASADATPPAAAAPPAAPGEKEKETEAETEAETDKEDDVATLVRTGLVWRSYYPGSGRNCTHFEREINREKQACMHPCLECGALVGSLHGPYERVMWRIAAARTTARSERAARAFKKAAARV